MATTRTPAPVSACAFCAGPMPPPAGTGRPAVFCSGACRKAAYEARRTAQPDAFEVKVVDRVVVESHDLSGCVEAVIASPAACRRVLAALAQLPAGTLEHDPKWRPTHTAALALVDALVVPPGRVPPSRRTGRLR
jgi:hypothetical protein